VIDGTTVKREATREGDIVTMTGRTHTTVFGGIFLLRETTINLDGIGKSSKVCWIDTISIDNSLNEFP
jgi:hypothetical protein